MKSKKLIQSTYLSLLALPWAVGLASGVVQAHDARIGTLHIIHPAAPATLPGQSNGVIYMAIENEGTTADRLISSVSPAASEITIHIMSMSGDTMKMRELPSLPLPPSTKTSMTAGSNYHLMLTGLKQPLRSGDKIPLTLTFERAGAIEVSVHVGPSTAQKGAPAVDFPAR